MELHDANIAVLIPAHNEERQIAGVIATVPAYVSHVVVVDDGSTDNTREVLRRCAALDPRVHLIPLDNNVGVGGAVMQAYLWAVQADVDVAVSIDADGQMDPDEMLDLIRPILEDRADYTKGNRLLSPTQWRDIPRIRLLGNSVLSLLTKIVSGYWTIADSQSGYTAASRYALRNIDWRKLYHHYGRPNDILVLANVAECRVADVPIKALYGVGEQSSMKIMKVVFAISLLLFRRFWWRLGWKYVLRDFHPLVFFYALATVTGVLGAILAVRLVVLWAINGNVPQMTAMALAFFVITALNSTFFAYWMDKEANSHLAVLHERPHRGATDHTREPPLAVPEVSRERVVVEFEPLDEQRSTRYG